MEVFIFDTQPPSAGSKQRLWSAGRLTEATVQLLPWQCRDLHHELDSMQTQLFSAGTNGQVKVAELIHKHAHNVKLKIKHKQYNLRRENKEFLVFVEKKTVIHFLFSHYDSESCKVCQQGYHTISWAFFSIEWCIVCIFCQCRYGI